VKASDPVRMREMRVFSAAVAVLFSLIMIYGLQHFYAIESSYRVESEKQTLEQLREENRQLAPERSRAHAAGRIDQMARQLGLAEPQPGQVVSSHARRRFRRADAGAGHPLQRRPAQ
jgi:cell division protein FtsL